MPILVYIFLWIAVGLLAGMAGDRVSDNDTTVGNLVWYGLFGWLTLAGFLIYLVISVAFSGSISRFWNKIVIKNKKGT
ncbi:hypothetical protein LCGC14_1731030 [marine sediment metagenome]|uniref:Uncharacterized protein n=1 Tax=marine sediment metagenome TaxID=412755 RepID=A0A0F9JQ41_9ZZZZ